MSAAVLRSDAVYDGATTNGTAQVQYVKIDTAASADLVTAVAGKRVRVLGLSLDAAGAVTAQLQSGGATSLTGAMSLATATPLVWPASHLGYVQTNAGEKLNLVLGGAVQVSGTLIYALI